MGPPSAQSGDTLRRNAASPAGSQPQTIDELVQRRKKSYPSYEVASEPPTIQLDQILQVFALLCIFLNLNIWK